ncbi:DUF2490 domain-containing protein [Lutibacter sp. B1]|uniref:DUF2490 domain-containing protein n=1 Tax=Lutibacter sp. B1 TaxID=2725996 RepID=UPI001456E580|nr:DUF2490 domain-containing protein [Lutibacter sp. B1]NLP58494.1 DUF2490 domain-containing protein [Lutibacter sp. B1]
MKKLILILFLVLAAQDVKSQIEVFKENGSWFTLSNKFKLSNKFYVGNLIQQRRVGFLKNTQAFLISPSVNYQINKNVSIGAGYMLYKYYAHGASHASITRDENRWWQHITVNSKVGNTTFNNRLMFEERTLDLINKDVTPNKIEGSKYFQRLRYRLQVTFNLFKLKNEQYILGKLSNEIRIRFTTGLNEPDFDQNNFEALLGYKLLDNSKIWLGYGRYYFKSNPEKFVSNNILHVTLSYDFDLTKKK